MPWCHTWKVITPAEENTTEIEDADRPLRLAIVGRPNVGKSSLLNRLVGSERSLTGPEAGITRDAVLAERCTLMVGMLLLHDTAGLRKKSHVVEKLEKLSTASTLNAIRFADCVILVMDALHALEKQDLSIADLIAQEGRAVVFAANKWDLVTNPANAPRIARKGRPAVAATHRCPGRRCVGAYRRRH